MGTPHYNSSQTTVLGFKRSQISYAALIHSPAVIHNQDVACSSAMDCFQKNIDTSKMPDWNGGTGDPLLSYDWPNTERRQAHWNFQTQSGIGDKRSGKFGKSER